MLRSVSDTIITIDNKVKVHRSLLLDVSDKMRYLVEQVEERQVQAASQDHSPAIKDPPGHLSVLDHANQLGAERGLVLWSSFLYGQPISVSSTDWAKEGHNGIIELFALCQVHIIALKYDHLDAEDASIDAIRDLLYHEIDSYSTTFIEVIIQLAVRVPVIKKIFMDFVVYGDHKRGFRYTDVVAMCIGPHENGNGVTSLWMTDLSEQQRDRVCQELQLLHLSNQLLKMFIQKGKDDHDGVPAPDLMARCRYHAHAVKGQPCYMDK